MAGNSVIGALRVNLGLDSAHFHNGLKQAQGSLSRFGLAAAAGLAAVAAAATTAGIALGRAVKSAVDRADDLGKMAQSAGVSVEALSRLEYAAKLSDVSLEGLGTGLRKLSQNMVAATTSATGPAAVAFAALGISVRNADGTLRSSTSVLGDVADRFARMDDSATKTALAISIFGKAGADLIPLLNAGSVGLAQMADQSDRLGLTISTSTAKAAERFNDTLMTISSVFQGVTAQLAQALLPALEYLSQAFLDVALDADFMKEFLRGVVEIFKIIVSAGAAVYGTLKAIGQAMTTLGQANLIMNSTLDPLTKIGQIGTVVSKGFEDIGTTARDATALIEGLWKAAEPKQASWAPWTKVTSNSAGNIPDIAAVAGGLRAGDKKMGWKGLIDGTNDSAKQLKTTLDTVGSALDGIASGFIDAFDDLKITGQEAMDVLLDGIKNLGKELANEAIRNGLKMLLGAFTGSIGGTSIGKGAASVFGGLKGWAGGGYTGNAPRLGGLDGQGGFLAMLHPQETVVDHAGGGSAGLTIQVDARGAQVGVAEQLDKWARMELPRIIRHHSRSTMPENG